MDKEIFCIIFWWLTIFALGLINLPFTFALFKRSTRLSFGFSKLVGVLTLSYIFFLLSIFKVLPLSRMVLFFILILLAFSNIVLFNKFKNEIIKGIKESLRVIFLQEILFSLGFVFWVFIKAHQPDINGLEKFMDFGFINSILKGKYLPPLDMWFSGNFINYYWFGHFITAVITKLSGIPAYISYNLMLATILGLTLIGGFTVVQTLVSKIRPKLNKRIPLLAGLISAVLLVFAGNFHTPFYVLKEGKDKYWYPDATRFIGYNPETNDKTIHEFPIYSFVVSDLHPHLLNLMFIPLFIALLLIISLGSFYIELKNLQKFFLKIGSWFPSAKKQNVIKNFFFEKRINLGFLPLGFLLGIFFMTNTWDFANYLLVSGITLMLFNIKKGINFKNLFYLGAFIFLAVLTAFLVASPFILNFHSIAQGVGFVMSRTPIWQLSILWGFPAVLTIVFIITLKISLKRLIKIKLMQETDLFVLALIIASWTLIALPEIIYVKDIYITSYHRANTMFKLTYQAYVMFYLSSGYIIARFIDQLKNRLRILAVVFFTFILTSILIYPYFAINSYYDRLKNYQGLNGEEWLSKKYPDIYNAIVWLRENAEGQPTILEAPGDSYTEFNVISSYSGLPTVSGWFVHEWLWRGSAEIPQKRVIDIQQIYTSDDINLTKTLLQKYNVKYVIVGPFEYKKFPNLKAEKFSQIGSEVFKSSSLKIYEI